MKKLFSIFAAAVISMTSVFALYACGKRGDDLIVWWVSGQKNEQIINEAIAAFKADNPGKGVRVVSKPGMDVFQAYKIALGDDKTRPDVAILDHVYVPALARDGLIADLSALGSEDIKSKYPEGLYNAVKYDDKAYGLPLSANTVALMYNKNILKAAGVTDDGTANGNVVAPATLDELYAACEKVKAIGRTPFAQPINSFAAMVFMSYMGRLGANILSSDYKTVTIGTDPLVRTALEKWKYFTDNGYAVKTEFEEGKFYTGQVAFVEMGSWNISKVAGAGALFDCGFAEMVTIDPALPNYSGLGLWSVVVAEKSVDKSAAYRLAEYLSTNNKLQVEFNKENGVFPVTNEALADSYYTSNPILATYASQLQKTLPRPGTPIWPDLELILVTMLRSAVLNNNVDGALTTAQNSAQLATNRVFGL